MSTNLTTSRHAHRRTLRRGYSMVETVISLVVIGVIAAASMPLISSAADNAVVARRTRKSADGAQFAMERVTRLLRDCPGSSTSLGITAATASSVTFSSGKRVYLSGTNLMLVESPGNEAILASDVTSFVIEYLADNATNSTLATPATTARFNITIVKDGVELRASAFPRCRAGVP